MAAEKYLRENMNLLDSFLVTAEKGFYPFNSYHIIMDQTNPRVFLVQVEHFENGERKDIIFNIDVSDKTSWDNAVSSLEEAKDYVENCCRLPCSTCRKEHFYIAFYAKKALFDTDQLPQPNEDEWDEETNGDGGWISLCYLDRILQ
jgi:hypothetical protein